MRTDSARDQEFVANMIEWNLKEYAPVLLRHFRNCWAMVEEREDLILLMRTCIRQGWSEQLVAEIKKVLGGAYGASTDLGQCDSTGPAKKKADRRKGKAKVL